MYVRGCKEQHNEISIQDLDLLRTNTGRGRMSDVRKLHDVLRKSNIHDTGYSWRMLDTFGAGQTIRMASSYAVSL